jgi:hypothetical protein
MKPRLLNILLLVSSLFGYLEWGGDNHSFLFEVELEIISKFFINPISLLHPFILLPLFGQIMLLIAVFQKAPGKIFTYLGIATLSLLFGFLFIIGLISLNLMIFVGSLPFIIVAIITINYYVKVKQVSP